MVFNGRFINSVLIINYMDTKLIKTKEDARKCAIKWQHWAWNESLSYSELQEWNIFFTKLAKKFGLKREFKNEGIL